MRGGESGLVDKGGQGGVCAICAAQSGACDIVCAVRGDEGPYCKGLMDQGEVARYRLRGFGGQKVDARYGL